MQVKLGQGCEVVLNRVGPDPALGVEGMLYTYHESRGTFVPAPQELDEVQVKMREHSRGDVYVKINGNNSLKKRVNTEDKRWTTDEEKLVHRAMRTVDMSLENR
jgi:hypothetical protein